MMAPRRNIKLTVIPKPSERTRPIFEAGGQVPVFNGGEQEAPDFVCGKCEAVLLTGLNRNRIINAVIKCSCGAFNDTTLVLN